MYHTSVSYVLSFNITLEDMQDWYVVSTEIWGFIFLSLSMLGCVETSGCGDVIRDMSQACLANLQSNVGSSRVGALLLLFNLLLPKWLICSPEMDRWKIWIMSANCEISTLLKQGSHLSQWLRMAQVASLFSSTLKLNACQRAGSCFWFYYHPSSQLEVSAPPIGWNTE